VDTAENVIYNAIAGNDEIDPEQLDRYFSIFGEHPKPGGGFSLFLEKKFT
jgi:hypothetical protein